MKKPFELDRKFHIYFKKLRSIWLTHFTEIPKEDYLRVLQDEVYSNPDFMRQIKEVSIKLDLPEDTVETAVKHYLTHLMKLLCAVQHCKYRILITGAFVIETRNFYYEKSTYSLRALKKFGRHFNLKRVLEYDFKSARKNQNKNDNNNA